TILISITALTYGPVSTGIAVLMTGVFRINSGGIGVLPGLATIVSSAIIGLLWRRFVYRQERRYRWFNVYIFSVIVHLAMLVCMLLLPWPTGIETIRRIAWPVLLIYPVASVLYSLLLLRQQDKAEAIRKQLEAEAQYRSLFEINHATMLLIDPRTGAIVDANPAAASYYGWPVEQLKRMKISDINTLTPDEIALEMKKSIQRNQHHFLFRHRWANGSVHDVEVYSGPIFIQGKDLLYSIVHDITERSRAEQELKSSEIRFRAVVENAPESIFILAQDRFAYLNPAAVRMFGAQSQHDLLGQSIFERAHPDYHSYVRERLASIQKLQISPPNQERVLVRLDQTFVPVEATTVSIRYNDEDCLLVFARDITRRKMMEQEKIDMEAQLRQQQKLEAIGTLAGGVAHEINNPINGIMNYAQIVQDDLGLDSPETEFLQGIIQESQRVAEIVRNLLQFSRQEKQSFSPARIEDIVNRTVSLIRTIIKGEQIELQIELEPELPLILCRSQQIQQVLMNLLTNARDALNEKFPEHHADKKIDLYVSRQLLGEKEWVRVRVKDHGVGLTEEARQKMFEPFFSTKPREKGTGLGLSISFGIVKDHGGLLEVHSEHDQYTQMDLYLPAAVSDE
ncbi:MAG: PAS domain S-box protein, partial [Clostridia bacterium]|nr:PAS domain S-box protein [Clostridia bacterium]